MKHRTAASAALYEPHLRCRSSGRIFLMTRVLVYLVQSHPPHACELNRTTPSRPLPWRVTTPQPNRSNSRHDADASIEIATSRRRIATQATCALYARLVISSLLYAQARQTSRRRTPLAGYRKRRRCGEKPGFQQCQPRRVSSAVYTSRICWIQQSAHVVRAGNAHDESSVCAA
jgi:hypothetical protein